MTGKKTKVAGIVRKTFALNVLRMMNERYAQSGNKAMSLAKDAGVSMSSIQRAIGGETAPNLDTVEAIAAALRVKPEYLLAVAEQITRREVGRTGTK
jgi:transcriptional regulator with XRE-family HTH domain